MPQRIMSFILFALVTSSGYSQPVKITKVLLVPQSVTDAPVQVIQPIRNVVTLTYQRNSLFIYFAAPGQADQFAFRLQGIILREIYTRNDYVFFSNLPAGEFEFTVRAVNRPSWQPATLKIIVESPIWLRWWFLPLMFLYGMLLVGVIFYFLYRYRLRQFLRVHAVRETIARDLHDDMGSYLSSISIMSQSVVNLAEKDPPKAHALVQKIGETARQVMDSMGDIIWSVNPDNDSMAQIVVRMRDVGADLLEGQNVIFTLDVGEALLHTHLPLEQRRDFFLIYKEALTNIAKYAGASHVWVKLGREDGGLQLTIQDDGVGFDPQQLTGQNPLGGNGLRNMRKRAKKMGGAITVRSAPGQGTTLTLQINPL